MVLECWYHSGVGGDGDFDSLAADIYCLFFDQNSLASSGDLTIVKKYLMRP